MYGDSQNHILNSRYIFTLNVIELHPKAVYNYTTQNDVSSQNYEAVNVLCLFTSSQLFSVSN